MTNNDILRRLRYTFNYNDSKMLEVFKLGGSQASALDLSNWLQPEESTSYLPMFDHELSTFLNGFIVVQRGTKDGEVPPPEKHMTNNVILRKLKIALSLKDDGMLEILMLAGRKISKHELSAFFRKPEQPQYRICNDQFLRNFLTGLQLKYRSRLT